MSIEGTIQSIAERLKESLEADVCTMRVLDGKMLRLMAADGVDSNKRKKYIPIKGTIAGDAFLTGQIVHVQDITKDPRYDSSFYLEPGWPTALLAIPLKMEEDVYAVAQIYRREPLTSKQVNLANILAQCAAPAFYHIEISKLNRQAIEEVIESIFECTTLEEMLKRAVVTISERLDVQSCLIYKIFTRDKEPWCQIVAGVPEGQHEIGLTNPLSKHPDIEFAVSEKKLIALDPLTNEKTKHLRDWAKNKNIKAIMYDPLVANETVIGILILEARGEKEGFSAEEKSFAFDAGKILGRFIAHERKMLDGIADSLINPNTSLGLYAKKLTEPLTKIFELAEECQTLNRCDKAQKIIEIAGKLLPLVSRLRLEAENIDRSYHKIREVQL